MPITRWLNADRYASRSTTDPVNLDFFDANDLNGANNTNLALIFASFSAQSPIFYNGVGNFSLLDPTVLNNLELTGDLEHQGAEVGFYGVGPIPQPLDIGAGITLTDSTGGTADGDLIQISGSGADADINDNFTELFDAVQSLQTRVDGLRTQQQSLGLMG